MSSSLRSSFVFLSTSYAKERYFTRGPRLCQQISFKTLFEHSSLSSTAERKTDDLIFLVHKLWLSVLNPGAAILKCCQAVPGSTPVLLANEYSAWNLCDSPQMKFEILTF